jgi:hypothetical protein
LLSLLCFVVIVAAVVANVVVGIVVVHKYY